MKSFLWLRISGSVQRFAFTQVWILKIVCPVAMMKNKCDYKIIEKLLRKSRPQTEADSDLQLKLQRQAPTCGNAMLADVLS